MWSGTRELGDNFFSQYRKQKYARGIIRRAHTYMKFHCNLLLLEVDYKSEEKFRRTSLQTKVFYSKFWKILKKNTLWGKTRRPLESFKLVWNRMKLKFKTVNMNLISRPFLAIFRWVISFFPRQISVFKI